jgi:hypothetical protein
MVKPHNRLMLFLLLCLPLAVLNAQEPIYLKNPSFEMDRTQSGVTPSYWINLGNDLESPPDIQPGLFDVVLRAHEGERYVGLVVRDNNTVEGIGQDLTEPILRDSVYQFSVHLARSPRFASLSRTTGEVAAYQTAVVLQVWGYNSYTQQRELLAESTPVTHTQWLPYVFEFSPASADYNRLELMAAYDAAVGKPYNGNLMIDACSPITMVRK